MRHIFAFLLLFCCSTVYADDTDERTLMARRLVQLVDVKATNLDANQCAKVSADESKAFIALYVRNPAGFGGISPQSAYWPEVAAAYRDIFSVMCGSSTSNSLEALRVKAYSTMSLADLRTAVDFYSSPVAHEMKLAAKRSLKDANATTTGIYSEEAKAAQEKFVEAMDQLAKKYKADPR
jgi:hypothetical protein